MRHAYRPDIPPKPQPSHTQICDHLGLVAGMFAALGITEVIDTATKQDPARRMVTAGHAGKAMVLNGLGFVTQQLDRVPYFFQHTPTSRRIAPAMQASHRNDDTLGRTLETLYDTGVTEISSRLAAPAATRLGLAPTFTQLDRTSVHVDGRSNSPDAPGDQGMHVPRGSRRDHRPDRNQVMLDLMVEHQAGMPIRMRPLSGNRSDTTNFGHVVRDHLAQGHLTDGTTSVVADRARQRADNLHKLDEPGTHWMTRVPAPLTEAQAVLAQADPETRPVLQDGDRQDVLASRQGGVDQRWILRYSAHRLPQAQRTVDTRWLQPRAQERTAWPPVCSTAFACAADAPQAWATCAHGVQHTCVAQSTVQALPRSGTRGRPQPGARPQRVDWHIAGALASSLATRQQLVRQQSCCILAPTARAPHVLSPQEVLEGYTGQPHAERGLRFLKDPQCLASSRSRKKPERLRALLMVMTGC